MQNDARNVFLETHNLDHTYREPCDNWSVDDMNKFMQKIQDIEIPYTSCIFGISATLTKTTRTSRIKKICLDWFKYNLPVNEEKLIITVNMDCVDRPCKTPDEKHCLNNIACGKCGDRFTIDLLGKTLFTEQYQNQK